MELSGSTLNGLPQAISIDDITTVWPCLLSDFEHDLVTDFNHSAASLLDPDLYHIVTDTSWDNVKGMFAKACLLMTHAMTLENQRLLDPEGTEEWWTYFEKVNRAVTLFTATMLPVHSSQSVGELASLVLVHSTLYCSEVQLHSLLAKYELIQGASGGFRGGLSYARCTEACRATALAARLVPDIDMSYMFLFIRLVWVCMAITISQNIARLRQCRYTTEAQSKEEQLAVIETCMERLVATYPILMLQLEQLQKIKQQYLRDGCFG